MACQYPPFGEQWMFHRFDRATRLLALAAAVTLALSACNPVSPQRQKAIDTCTERMKSAAKNPSSAEIPKPDQQIETESGQRLTWNHGGGLRFMNNMGTKLDSSAVCVTSASGIVLEKLLIDGQFIWDLDAVVEAAQRANQAQRAAPAATKPKRAPVDAAEAASMAAADAAAAAGR